MHGGHHQPSEWVQIVGVSSLVCTGARRNPATCGTNQEARKRRFGPALRAGAMLLSIRNERSFIPVLQHIVRSQTLQQPYYVSTTTRRGAQPSHVRKSFGRNSGRKESRAAVERVWHIQDSQGQTKASPLRQKSFTSFKLLHFPSEAEGEVRFHCEGGRGDRVRGVIRNVQRFRGGLVFQAHRLCVSLNSRLESNEENEVYVVGSQGR